MSGTLKKRGKIWHGRIRYKGKEFTKSLQTESKTLARERLNKWVDQLKADNWGEKLRHTFNEAVERMVIDHFPNIKRSSAERYACSLEHLIDHFSGKDLNDITSKHMIAFEKKRLDQGRSTSTVRRDLACLSVLFSCAEEWEWYDKNPVKAFLRSRKRKGLTEAPERTRYLSSEEEAKILQTATTKMAPMIAFAIDTGLRREEQFSLTWSQVNLREREIHIEHGMSKSGKQRFVPIPQRSVEILESLPRDMKSRFVFNNGSGRRYSKASPYIYDGLQKAAKRAGVKDIRWHDLRRTCGCRLLQEKGFIMEEVRDWLGHSSVTVTERIYAFLAKDQLQNKLRTSESKILSFPG